MISTIEGKIIDTLLTHVGEVLTDYPIAYPDVDYTPTGEPYYDIDHLPNGIAQSTFSSRDALQGILQISYIGKLGRGAVSPQDEAGKIIAALPKGKRIFGHGISITIQNQPVAAQTFIEDAYTRTPVTIQYIAR